MGMEGRFVLAGRRSTLLGACTALLATSASVANIAPVAPASLGLPAVQPAAAVAPAGIDALGTWYELLIPADIERTRSARLARLGTAELIDMCAAGLPGCPADWAACTACIGGEPIGEAAGEAVIQLPAPPSGGVLTLTGLLTLGALRLGRSAGQMQWSQLPEWYHHAGPEQIGHRRAYDVTVDLVVSLAALPACCFTQPFNPQPTIHRGTQDAFIPLLLPQCLPTLAAPRGPPAVG